MKFIYNFVYLLLMTLCFYSCKNSKHRDVPTKRSNYIDGYVHFTGKKKPDDNFIVNLARFNFVLQSQEGIRYGNVLSRNNYFLEFPSSKVELLNIFYEDIIVSPGDTISIDVKFDTDEEKITSFNVKGKQRGNYLYYFTLKRDSIKAPLIGRFGDSQLMEYKKAVGAYKAKRIQHLKLFNTKNPMSKPALELVMQEINLKCHVLISNICYSYNKTKIALGNDYFKGFKPIIYGKNDSLTCNTYYCLMMLNALQLTMMKSNIKLNSEDYFKKTTTHILTNYHGKLREFLLLSLAKDYEKIKPINGYSPELVKIFHSFQSYFSESQWKDALLKCDIDGKANFRIASNVKNVKLGNLNRQIILLDTLLKRKHFLYLDFWASWCKPCIKEFSNISETNKLLKKKGIDYILINVHEGVYDTWKQDHDKFKITQFESYQAFDIDANLALSGAFDISTIPKFIMIAPNGEILTFKAPRPSDIHFEEKINQLIK